jgi:hypothetical protein
LRFTILLASVLHSCRGDREDRRRMMPAAPVRIFPPKWNRADQWSVAMKTQAPAPADFRPGYVERTFSFRVSAVPHYQSPFYQIEVQSHDLPDRGAYSLYYRSEDFSLEKVTRQKPGETEETVIENGRTPFIYYERRLPLVPDFPIAAPSGEIGRREFLVAGNQMIQEMQLAGERARIKLERIEPLGSLRVIMEWAAGDPWWSDIECTENPPPNAFFEGEVVASGRLIRRV